jgi:hypothetical protein
VTNYKILNLETTKVGWAPPTIYRFSPNPMPDYRRVYTPGGAVFLTLVTFNRRPIFAVPENVQRLRWAMATAKAEMPFDVTAAVILPDHIPGQSHLN